VVFSDGTGQEGGRGDNTNVYKLFNMIEDRTEHQVSFYDRGLGTGMRKGLAEKKLPQELFANFAGTHPTSLSRVSSLKDYVKEKGWTFEGPRLPPIE